VNQPEGIVIDLSRYVFETLREDEELVLERGQEDRDLSAILVVALSQSIPFQESWSGLSTNMRFGLSLIQTGRLDLSPWLVVRVGQCLYSRTLAVSHSIGSWENRWN
jgi:hypothetical protein